MVEKEKNLVEELCGKRYSREKKEFKRCKTQKKTILTKFGKIKHAFAYAKNKTTGRTFSPLLEWLEIRPYQRLSQNFKQVLSRKASRSTYQLGVEDIQDSFGFSICRQTLHTYVKQTCYGISCIGGPNPDHLIPLLDKQEKNGTKCREADADSAFGFIQNYISAEARHVILHSPVRNFDPEKLSVYDLKYDKEKHELTCINNVTVKGRNSGALTFEFPLKTCRACPKSDQCCLSPSKVTTLNKNYMVVRKAMARQREDREIDKQNREKGIKNFKRLVVENVFAFLEKLKIKVTPAYSLMMTKVHVDLVVTLSNMIKTVRQLKKKREKERLHQASQNVGDFEQTAITSCANFLACRF